MDSSKTDYDNPIIFMPSFTARVAIIGVNPYVTPPSRVLLAVFSQADAPRGPVPVRGTLNGAAFQQTLVRYRGAWRLYLNGPMLKAGGGPGVGDRVHLELAFDPAPRTYPMPPAFKRALALPANRAARVAFAKLAPSRQKELNRYLGFAKTPATLERNVWIIVDYLREQAKDPGAWPRGLWAVLRAKK